MTGNHKTNLIFFIPVKKFRNISQVTECLRKSVHLLTTKAVSF